MKRLTYVSENVNTWNNKKNEDIAQLEIECSACSSTDNFSLIKNHTIWRWEIHIPYDWEYNQWERIRLYPVEVQVLIVKCLGCGKKFSLYPSFVVEGTTLTLPALIFIAFTYETSTLTWRELPEKFCDQANKIAHSTLYKAVHGLGQSIKENEQIRKEIDALAAKYLPKTKAPSWPSPKSVYPYTKNREQAVRETIYPLNSPAVNFTHFFYRYLRQLSALLSMLAPPVCSIYHKQHKTADTPPSLPNSETPKAC